MSPPAPVLQTYFTDRLIGQRAASPNVETIVGTAQFSEATRAKLRNRLRLLMRKLEREEAIQEVGDGSDTARSACQTG